MGAGDERVLLALHVDNLLIVWNSKESLTEVKQSLKELFTITYLGCALFLLGMEIKDG